MTREMKIKIALDVRDEKIKDLKEEYSFRFGELRVNDCGETNRHDLLDLKEWYVEEQNKIDNEFIKAIKGGQI